MTVVHFVPSMLAVFVAEASADELTSLRHVFASGEALPPALAARTRALLSDAGLHNLVRAVTETAPHDYEAEFSQGLDALLDGYHALLRRARRAPQSDAQ